MREQAQAQDQAQGQGQEREPAEEREPAQDQEQPKASVFSAPVSLVLIGPALLLLRFLGESTWGYWTAAVIGVTGTVIAVFEFVAAIRSLLRRRRMLASVWVVLLVATGVFMLGVRLSGR
ncbi:hypothetical protein J7E88_26545 [Streptomyces sp. ISL-10]|uniref:hypothetical protein n=1 Tax=Streptomyces sp. ISL-10 TaxID=2819172 RepID=UPI001BE5489E|nr:hypothetical protein [Streptomyces sp. ISL-10]MBT2368797.1 hypothetical protein [Streptomyces sp. ISL-10]